MKANAVPLLALFEKKMRLEVPLFQRKYVWKREQQWEPLWEDICRKFTEFLENRKDAPIHFLGAMVLDLKQTPATHVEKRQVIDGQQRLTTFQIFLAALRDLCREHDCNELAKELENFTINKGMMASPEVDKFKVWPTQADRDQFSDAMTLGSFAAIESKYPLKRKKYTRKFEPRPPMIEAYLYFYEELRLFFLGDDQTSPISGEHPLAARIEECFQALKNALHVVAIDLESGDDAQVIFETLNARGEPLLPADLLRNYIFLRAGRANESQEMLYDRYWRGFDDEFWHTNVTQGRLTRPRSDLFMQHFLSSRRMFDIPVKHLFVEYRHWIEKERPFSNSVTDELATLARQREDFRLLIAPTKEHWLCDIAAFLLRYDVGTAYPLFLYLLDEQLPQTVVEGVFAAVESYLVRRYLLGWTTKAYNRVFLNLIKTLRSNGATAQNASIALAELAGESVAWPTDSQFHEAWSNRPAYYALSNAKLVHMLLRLSSSYTNVRHEQVSIDGPLTVEHILPQTWQQNWPLSDGQMGLTPDEMDEAPVSPAYDASARRNSLVHTIGNLTLLTQELNSSVSNANWIAKKPELMKHSLLPINQQLHSFEKWNEDAIVARSKGLFERALKI